MADMRYRAVTLQDAARLFAWRNNDLTRAMSRSATAIEWEEHLCWLEHRLSRDQPHLYIAAVGPVPVGTFRIDGDEVSYTIAPEFRSLGYCRQMLTMVVADFGKLRAEIFRRNIPSIKAATAAGLDVVLID